MRPTTGQRARATWGTFDCQAVGELYDDYASLADDGDYEAWLGLFVPDATYVATARENIERGLPLATIRCESRAMLADRIDAITTTQFYARRVARHFISAIRPVGLSDEELTTTCNFLVVETLAGEPSQVHVAGSYHDRIVSTDGGLRFAAKVAVYDAPLIRTSLVVPL